MCVPLSLMAICGRKCPDDPLVPRPGLFKMLVDTTKFSFYADFGISATICTKVTLKKRNSTIAVTCVLFQTIGCGYGYLQRVLGWQSSVQSVEDRIFGPLYEIGSQSRRIGYLDQ